MDIADYTMHEIWRPIPGWEDRYEVSSFGQVRSLRRKERGKNVSFVICDQGYRHPIKDRSTAGGGAGTILKGSLNGRRKCYRTVSLWKNNRASPHTIHSLVLLTFVCARPPGMEANHIDGNPANNAVTNLQWVTPEQNKQHARTMGKFSRSTGRPKKP